jgi:hypothetical protein
MNFLTEKTFNLVYTAEPFLKQIFLEETTKNKLPIIYLDFDLLYTGYVKMGIIPNDQNIRLYQVYSENMNGILTDTILQVSKKPYLVIIDSLNGFYNTFNKNRINSSRLVNSYLALLATASQQSKSIVVCSCIAKKRQMRDNKNRLLLEPIHRYITHLKNMNIIQLENERAKEQQSKTITMNFLNDDLAIRASSDLNIS